MHIYQARVYLIILTIIGKQLGKENTIGNGIAATLIRLQKFTLIRDQTGTTSRSSPL